MWEEEGTTNCESGGDQSKEIGPVNVSLQSCRKIGWKIKIDILEGGFPVLHFAAMQNRGTTIRLK